MYYLQTKLAFFFFKQQFYILMLITIKKSQRTKNVRKKLFNIIQVILFENLVKVDALKPSPY